MGAAMRNERFAVRQRLVEVYRAQLTASQTRLQLYWRETAARLETLAAATPASAAFANCARSGLVDSAVICDEQGRISYPSRPAAAPGDFGEHETKWQQANRLENMRNPVEAAARYDALARETADDNAAARAFQAEARCLAQAGQNEAVVQRVDEIFKDERYRHAADPQGRLIAANVELLALELGTNRNSAAFQSIVGRLATRLTDYDNLALAAPQRRFLMQEMLTRFPEKMDFPTLLAEKLAAEVADLPGGTQHWPTAIESGKAANAALLPLPVRNERGEGRGEGEFTADAPAHLQARRPSSPHPSPSSAGGEGSDAFPILHRSPLPDLWQFSTPNRRVLAFIRLDKLLAATRDIIASDSVVAGVKVALLPPDLDAAEAFVSLPAGDQMPGWRLALSLEGRERFIGSAGRQTVVYLWTGILAMAGMGVLTVLAVRLVRRQMTLARLKSDLAATVSHELKTPLSSMRVLVETLLDSEKLDEQKTRDYLQLIARENERLGRLIQNFLTYSRMERRKHTFHFSLLPPRQIIDAAIASVQGRLEAPGCRLELEIEDPLPPVLADSDALTTALINLLDNACKYSEEIKHIVVGARTANGSVLLSVSDNGVGIAPRERTRIFRPFYQADQRLSRQGSGCGLGLSIVQFITTAHHGRVSVESQPGRGSTFTIALPVTPDAASLRRKAIA